MRLLYVTLHGGDTASLSELESVARLMSSGAHALLGGNVKSYTA